MAHEAQVLVIVDAADELPPATNLRRFSDEGADLVIFSGGKAIEGSGLILGNRDPIEACTLSAFPNYAIGRPMHQASASSELLVFARNLSYTRLMCRKHSSRSSTLNTGKDDVMRRLKAGDPPIYVLSAGANVVVTTEGLRDGDEEVDARRIREVVAEGNRRADKAIGGTR